MNLDAFLPRDSRDFHLRSMCLQVAYSACYRLEHSEKDILLKMSPREQATILVGIGLVIRDHVERDIPVRDTHHAVGVMADAHFSSGNFGYITYDKGAWCCRTIASTILRQYQEAQLLPSW